MKNEETNEMLALQYFPMHFHSFLERSELVSLLPPLVPSPHDQSKNLFGTGGSLPFRLQPWWSFFSLLSLIRSINIGPFLIRNGVPMVGIQQWIAALPPEMLKGSTRPLSPFRSSHSEVGWYFMVRVRLIVMASDIRFLSFVFLDLVPRPPPRCFLIELTYFVTARRAGDSLSIS